MQATQFDREHNAPLMFDLDGDERARLADYPAFLSLEACEVIAPLLERMRDKEEQS